jgi:hypothetical protein
MPCGSQGCRHIPCAVLKIESVAHRYLADGTAECACYYASQQSYLLVTEDDFARAAGVAKVMVE